MGFGAGLPGFPTFGNVGGALKQLAPQIAAQYVHVAWEAINNAARKGRTKMMLIDPYVDLWLALDREQVERAKAKPKGLPPSPEVSQKWGALGDLVFDLVTAPESMDVTDGVTYARHAIVGGKARLELTGQELQEVRLAFRWNHLVHDIEGNLEALLTAMREGKVLDLVIGDEAGSGIYAGEYVITRIPHKVDRHREDGSIASVELTVELLEWVPDPELKLRPPAPAKRTKKKTTPATSAQAKKG